MGYFSQLALNVEELLFDGYTNVEIAERLNISVAEVQECINQLEDCDRDDYFDEGDDGYALASAGFGMDEDYGYAGEDF